MALQDFSIYLFQQNKELVDIKKHIKQLIIDNKGVVIPGLGGFTAEYEPAAFDVTENKFLPPTNKISFNAQYTFSDDKLINLIAQKENTDKEKAKLQVESFVIQVKSQLKAGKTVAFPQIGTLRQDSKGKIHFARDKQSNLLAEAYGLKDLKTRPLEKESQPTVPVQKRSKSGKKIWITILSTAAIFLIIALSWYFTDGFTHMDLISSQQTVSRKDVIKEQPKTKAYLDSIAREDSLKAVINKTIDVTTNKKEALFYQEPETKTPEEKKQYAQFHIIAGSFKKMENAEKFCNELKAKGYNPEIIESDKNLLRISIYSYPDEISALKKLYQLRETSEIKSVWILKTL